MLLLLARLGIGLAVLAMLLLVLALLYLFLRSNFCLLCWYRLLFQLLLLLYLPLIPYFRRLFVLWFEPILLLSNMCFWLYLLVQLLCSCLSMCLMYKRFRLLQLSYLSQHIEALLFLYFLQPF